MHTQERLLNGTFKRYFVMSLGVPGYLGTWVPGYLGTWVPGYLGTWVPGYLGTWVPGYLGTWVPGYLGTWVPGYLGTWVPGACILTGGTCQNDRYHLSKIFTCHFTSKITCHGHN